MIRKLFGLGGLQRPRGLIGGVQGGVSSANLQQVLVETKGLSSSNLSTALSGGVTPGTPSTAPTAAPAPTAPAPTSTPSKS
jgi:hypothetical protein